MNKEKKSKLELSTSNVPNVSKKTGKSKRKSSSVGDTPKQKMTNLAIQWQKLKNKNKNIEIEIFKEKKSIDKKIFLEKSV